jgi:hypothetical protein
MAKRGLPSACLLTHSLSHTHTRTHTHTQHTHSQDSAGKYPNHGYFDAYARTMLKFISGQYGDWVLAGAGCTTATSGPPPPTTWRRVIRVILSYWGYIRELGVIRELNWVIRGLRVIRVIFIRELASPLKCLCFL